MLLLVAGCGSGDDVPPPEPRRPPPVRAPEDPRGKLPPEKFIDQDPPSCCRRLTGGWEYSRIAAPGSQVTGTLSIPGPVRGTEVKVDADVRFAVTEVTAEGRRLRLVKERIAHVGVVKDFSVPYLTVNLPRKAPAYYALELDFTREGRRLDHYVSYVYVPPQRAAAALLLDRKVARPGETLELTIENRGPTPLEFGLAYRLERWRGYWKWLNRDDAFISIAIGVSPGRRYRQAVHLPSDAKPGRYRVSKSLTARSANRELEVAAQFKVR